MPRKTTILIILLAAITGILIFLAVRNENNPLSQNNTQATTEPTVGIAPFASLGFANTNNLVDVSNSSSVQTVDITIDTQGKPVAGAQIELSYNPLILTDVKFVPADVPFFGKDAGVLFSSVDQTQGRASYAVGNEKGGTASSGTIVKLSFTVNKSSGANSTQISFIDKSAVTSFDSQTSVLKNTTPLQIILAKPATN